MRISVIAVAVILATLAVATMGNNCLSCRYKGDICTNTEVCVDGTACIVANSTTTTKYCTEVNYPALNENCNKTDANPNSICQPGLTCNTTSFICQQIHYLGNGESCTADNQCNGGLTCVSGVCTLANYPACTPAVGAINLCKAAEYCNGTQCVAKIAVGANCTAFTPCVETAFCSSDSNTCVAYGSVANGGKCNTDYQCVDGSGCNDDGKCATITSVEGQFCDLSNSSASCGGWGFCVCHGDNTGNGTCANQPLVKNSDYVSYLTCLSKCPAEDNIIADCRSKCSAPEVSNESVCPGNSASSVAVNVLLFVVAFVALLF